MGEPNGDGGLGWFLQPLCSSFWKARTFDFGIKLIITLKFKTPPPFIRSFSFEVGNSQMSALWVFWFMVFLWALMCVPNGICWKPKQLKCKGVGDGGSWDEIGPQGWANASI